MAFARSSKSLVFLLVLTLVGVAAPARAHVSVIGFEGAGDAPEHPGYRGEALAVDVRAGSHWGVSRFIPVPGSSPDEAWFRYMLSFDTWGPSQAGKLPGFSGLRSHTARGCFPATSSDPGWSARMMYRASGTMGASQEQSRIGYYVYHLDQPRDCGEILEWNDFGVLDAGRWYCVEGHVRLNDPGRANGALDGWVDGHPAFARDDFRFREDDTIGVDDFWLNIYSGGKQPSRENLHLRVDEVVISDAGRIGCPDAFDDDEESIHEQALNRLADMEVFHACGAFLACPDDPITRGDFFGMVAGVVDFAPGPNAFDDDDSHWAATAIDALSAGGLIRGCGDRLVCPNDPITRADAARLLVAAFGLPPGDPTGFEDVTDPAVAATADALAGAGIGAGCGLQRFCPMRDLTRGQAAALVAKAAAQNRVPSGISGRAHRPTLMDAYARQHVLPRRPAVSHAASELPPAG